MDCEDLSTERLRGILLDAIRMGSKEYLIRMYNKHISLSRVGIYIPVLRSDCAK